MHVVNVADPLCFSVSLLICMGLFCSRMQHTISGGRGVAHVPSAKRGGGLGSRPKKMYGERLGDGVEYH